MEKIKSPSTPTQAEVVAVVRGKGQYMSDSSFIFQPMAEPGEPLYTETVVTARQGDIKRTDKSFVLRVRTDARAADPRADMMHQATDLIRRMPGAEPLPVPDGAELVGRTPHASVFLSGGKAVLQCVVPFDEADPRLKNIIAHATPEQMKYIHPHLEPEVILQQEVAELCRLLHQAKERHAAAQNPIVKPTKPQKRK